MSHAQLHLMHNHRTVDRDAMRVIRLAPGCPGAKPQPITAGFPSRVAGT